MSQENVEGVRLGFELWNVAVSDPAAARRHEAMQAMAASYHPEAEIDFSRTTPDSTPTRGPGAMIAWMREAHEAFENVKIEPTEIIDAGDTVIVATRIAGTGTTSGAAVTLEYAYVFSFSEHQVIAATSYATLEQALNAAGLAE